MGDEYLIIFEYSHISLKIYSFGELFCIILGHKYIHMLIFELKFFTFQIFLIYLNIQIFLDKYIHSYKYSLDFEAKNKF